MAGVIFGPTANSSIYTVPNNHTNSDIRLKKSILKILFIPVREVMNTKHKMAKHESKFYFDLQVRE